MTTAPGRRGRGLRVTLDGTPLLGRRTGVGTYVDRLVHHLAGEPGLDVTVSPVTVRGGSRPDLPDSVRWVRRPAPARALRMAWTHVDAPAVQLFSGRSDVYHGTNFVLPPLAGAAGVLTVHDLTYLHHRGTVDTTSLAYRELVPRGLRRAALVLTPSESVAAEVRAEYRLADDRVRASPLGVDPAWADAAPLPAAARAALRLPPEGYVVFVGTPEPRKNLAWLVAAHRLARQEHGGDVPGLVLCGGGGWGQVGDLGGTVRTGYLDLDVLRSVVSAATALVLPSRYEGFGLPVLEALACGVPTICTDLPVLREVGGRHATYVPLDDVAALAGAIVAVASPPDEAADAADAGAARAARREHARGFSWSRCAAATARAYRDAAG